jgi:N-acetylglucosaminyl-diphospho-decaprenol L-rhamnosyltransferase
VTPRVSVVIVSYHSREPLGRCLESLARAAVRVPLETIVVDNAPGDGTVEWLGAAWPDVRVIANPDNAGFTRGVNQGLAVATGAALLVLNPDCEVEDGALERLLAALAADPRAAAVAPALVDAAGKVARSCGRFPGAWSLWCDHFGLASAFPDSALFGAYKYGGTPMARLDVVDWASGAALLVSREAYATLGGLDEGLFMYMEEVDWCRRAAHAGLHIRYVADARVLHVGQLSSRTTPGPSYLHNLRSRVYYYRKHHGSAAALYAALVMQASLAAKWVVTRLARGARSAMVYRDGMAAVWEAAWR